MLRGTRVLPSALPATWHTPSTPAATAVGQHHHPRAPCGMQALPHLLAPTLSQTAVGLASSPTPTHRLTPLAAIRPCLSHTDSTAPPGSSSACPVPPPRAERAHRWSASSLKTHSIQPLAAAAVHCCSCRCPIPCSSDTHHPRRRPHTRRRLKPTALACCFHHSVSEPATAHSSSTPPPAAACGTPLAAN